MHLDSRGTLGWRRRPVTHLEDWADGVLGAGFDATQMSHGAVQGSLVFAERDGITFSSGLVGSRVALAGPLSQDRVTLGLGITFPPGSSLWLDETDSGAVGVFLPGDEHEALYSPGALYATVALDADHLEAEAARRGLILNLKMLGGTRVDARRAAQPLDDLRAQLMRAHAGFDPHPYIADPARQILDVTISHFAREPRPQSGRANPQGLALVVTRARDFIEAHLETPLAVDAIAHASLASRRTLFRAFVRVLGETPGQYVRRRRLHRIRHDLATWPESLCTITMISNRWGISELGRMAGWYRELFGERPSDTLHRAQTAAVPAGWHYLH